MDDATARKNLVKSPAPIYPAIAQAAHVTGVVALEVEIGDDGYVTSAKVLSGPAMLKGAALDAVAHWKFKPFLSDGKPEAVKAKLLLPFSAKGADVPAPPEEKAVETEDQRIAAVFFPLEEKCRTLVAARGDTAEQAQACQAAAQQAEKFAPDARFIERRSSFVYAASALLRNQSNAEALVYGGKAVDVVALGHDDGSGSSAAFAVRGQAEAFNGELDKADADLTKAEAYERDAIKTIGIPTLETEYKRALRNLLGFHASVLKGLGRENDGAALLQEAEDL